jgi:hypothetical protein
MLMEDEDVLHRVAHLHRYKMAAWSKVEEAKGHGHGVMDNVVEAAMVAEEWVDLDLAVHELRRGTEFWPWERVRFRPQGHHHQQ